MGLSEEFDRKSKKQGVSGFVMGTNPVNSGDKILGTDPVNSERALIR